MQTARWILAFAAVYTGIGAIFAMLFLTFGIERVDPAARGTGWGFRVLVFPGIVALWPVMGMRWARSIRART